MFVNPRKRWPRRGRGSLLFRGSGVASELASYNEQRCILEYLLEFVRFMVDLFELFCCARKLLRTLINWHWHWQIDYWCGLHGGGHGGRHEFCEAARWLLIERKCQIRPCPSSKVNSSNHIIGTTFNISSLCSFLIFSRYFPIICIKLVEISFIEQVLSLSLAMKWKSRPILRKSYFPKMSRQIKQVCVKIFFWNET